MKLFLYKLLTQVIIILGRLRDKLGMKTVIRNDRVFIDPRVLRFFTCCDCGLAHTIFPYNDEINLVKPARVEGYDYSWRKFSVGGTPFASEQEALDSLVKEKEQ